MEPMLPASQTALSRPGCSESPQLPERAEQGREAHSCRFRHTHTHRDTQRRAPGTQTHKETERDVHAHTDSANSTRPHMCSTHTHANKPETDTPQ